MNERIKRVIDKLIDGELKESSVTSAGESYENKKAYLEPQKTGQASKYLITRFKFTRAKMPKHLQSFDVKKFGVKEEINEISYRRFNEDVSKVTSERKIVRALNEVRKRIREIEQVIEYSQRLKTENTIKKDTFWTSKTEELGHLSERLNQLSSRIRNLSQ